MDKFQPSEKDNNYLIQYPKFRNETKESSIVEEFLSN